MREFYAYVRGIASERGDVKEFSAANKDMLQDRPHGATERFIETGDAGIPVKPVR